MFFHASFNVKCIYLSFSMQITAKWTTAFGSYMVVSSWDVKPIWKAMEHSIVSTVMFCIILVWILVRKFAKWFHFHDPAYFYGFQKNLPKIFQKHKTAGPKTMEQMKRTSYRAQIYPTAAIVTLARGMRPAMPVARWYPWTWVLWLSRANLKEMVSRDPR